MTRAAKVCNVHGCPEIATHRGRCEQHKPPPRPGRGSTRRWRQTRARILKRDGYRCTFMDGSDRCETTDDLEVHHILEVQFGGTDDDWNLRTLCATHHKLSHKQS
jgi:5-methylcytosine-specific restriction protein A